MASAASVGSAGAQDARIMSGEVASPGVSSTTREIDSARSATRAMPGARTSPTTPGYGACDMEFAPTGLSERMASRWMICRS